MTKVLAWVLLASVVTYLLRALPLVLHKGKEPSKFVKSFLEYIPYAALGGLLFPEIIYSTGNKLTAVVGGVFASILVLKKVNMIVVVFGSILVVYILNLYL